MKFRNPYYVDPIAAEAAALEGPIRTYLQGKPGLQFVGLAKLKTNVPAVATASREAITHVLQGLGCEIDEAGAENA